MHKPIFPMLSRFLKRMPLAAAGAATVVSWQTYGDSCAKDEMRKALEAQQTAASRPLDQAAVITMEHFLRPVEGLLRTGRAFWQSAETWLSNDQISQVKQWLATMGTPEAALESMTWTLLHDVRDSDVWHFFPGLFF
jgi:hypothetical protein